MATGSHLVVNLQELEMLKREMPHQMPAGVQRSTSLDSMPPPAQPTPITNNSANNTLQQQQQQQQQQQPQQQPQQPMVSMPEIHNSLSSPQPQACPVQRSRSLPLLDASQDISAEILAQLTERDNESMMVAGVAQHSLQHQQQQPQQQQQQQQQEQQQQQQQQHNNIDNAISDSISTGNAISISNVVSNNSNIGHFPFSDYTSPSQSRLMPQSQLQQATQLQESSQPLNLSQTADVRQILSQSYPGPNIQRAANFAGRQVQVGRDYLPQGFDWTNFPQAARYAVRPSEPRLGFPSMLPPGIGQMTPAFNPTNFASRGIDNYGSAGEGIRYSVPAAMNPNFQRPTMPLSFFPPRHCLPVKEEDRQSPKDVSRVLNVPMDQSDNNNDKSSPNIQALSDNSGGSLGEKGMMSLSVNVSVSFSEPSQDSPAFSQQSNSPALCKPAADQTLSMINYHDDHLLSDSGLMSNSPVPSTLDESFLNSTMGISTTTGSRLGDAANLPGLDSNPPSVKMEAFDLFEGSGDVDDQNYITDSISPQSLSMEASDSSQGLPNTMQAGPGNPRPLSQPGVSPSQHRGLEAAPQQGNNGPVSEVPQPRPRKGRPKVGGGHGHRYQQPCPTCGKVFGSSSALAKHKLIHSNERRHKCLLCAKSFKRQDHLTGHMLTHRSKKPYECAVDNCGKSYCDIRSLRRHFESQHAGLVMEDNMNYTGDEKDPELMAAEAAAVQASRQNQALMRGSPNAEFALGLGNPQDLNQSGSSHTSQESNSDGPGASSSAALQSLALAAQRVQGNHEQAGAQGQLLTSQEVPPLYRLDTYTSQMFGGGMSSHVAQSILSGSGGVPTSLPSGTTGRELSIQVPNPRVQGLSLSSGMGLTGNGTLPHHPGGPRFQNQTGLDIGSVKGLGTSNRGHRMSDPKERVTVECSVCKRTFKSMPALNGHMRLHGGYNNARGEVVPKVPPPKLVDRPPQPPPTSNNPPRPLIRPPSVSSMGVNNHSQLIQSQTSQMTGQHRVPLHMAGGPVSNPPTTMHLSSVYTNTSTSHVPSWDYRHPRPQTVVTSGKPASYLQNISFNSLSTDELHTLAHTAVGLAAQTQAMQKSQAQLQQPIPPPPQHLPLHHTTPLPMNRIQPGMPINPRMPVASKPFIFQNSQIVQKEEPFPTPPNSLRSPSPPKLEAECLQDSLAAEREMFMGKEIKEEPKQKESVFRDPPPMQGCPPKKKPKPPSLFIPSWASTVQPGGIAPCTYQSQMRSPREIGVLYRSNSSTTPPPYTPPPMLSPIRSGSGLYFSVGSNSMPAAVTPKSAFPLTPSMLQMHRRGSVSASTEDSDFAFPSEPHINVGCDYQAAIPDLVKSKEDILEKPDPREGYRVWDSDTYNKYSESEFTNFMALATTPSLPAGARNVEYAYHCLQRAKGDIEMALIMLLSKDALVPEEDEAYVDYRYDFSQEWTQAQRKLFRDMYKAKGKDFHEIAKGIPNKTVQDCVEYYYWWKKLYPYNHDMQKYCHHSGVNPNEDMRRNECDLFHGETFLDYVPLKEYRHDKYYRGGPPNSRNNNSVKTSSNNQEDKPAVQQGPFVCSYPHCDAAFKSRQALNGHIRVHGGSYKPTNNTTTTSLPSHNTTRTTTTTSARGGGGVGQNDKKMPATSSSDEMSDDEEDDKDDDDGEGGSSLETSDNDQDDDDYEEARSSSDYSEVQVPRFPCRICGKVFDKVKSRSAHMKSHRNVEDKKGEPLPLSTVQQEVINHYMNQGGGSRSATTSEEEDDEDDNEDEEEEEEEEEDEGMTSEEEEMSD